jgi:hypothetical protein
MKKCFIFLIFLTTSSPALLAPVNLLQSVFFDMITGFATPVRKSERDVVDYSGDYFKPFSQVEKHKYKETFKKTLDENNIKNWLDHWETSLKILELDKEENWQRIISHKSSSHIMAVITYLAIYNANPNRSYQDVDHNNKNAKSVVERLLYGPIYLKSNMEGYEPDIIAWDKNHWQYTVNESFFQSLGCSTVK